MTNRAVNTISYFSQSLKNSYQAILFFFCRLRLGRKSLVVISGTNVRIGATATRLVYHIAAELCRTRYALVVCGDRLIHESVVQSVRWQKRCGVIKPHADILQISLGSQESPEGTPSSLYKKSLFPVSMALSSRVGTLFLSYGTAAVILLPGSFPELYFFCKNGIFDGVVRRKSIRLIFVGSDYWKPIFESLSDEEEGKHDWYGIDLRCVTVVEGAPEALAAIHTR